MRRRTLVIPGCARLGADPESSAMHCSGFRVRSLSDKIDFVNFAQSSRPGTTVEMRTQRLRRHHLVADDEEFREIHSPKTRGQCHVGGVAAGAHQDTADAGMVVAGGGAGAPPPPQELETARENTRR